MCEFASRICRWSVGCKETEQARKKDIKRMKYEIVRDPRLKIAPIRFISSSKHVDILHLT